MALKSTAKGLCPKFVKGDGTPTNIPVDALPTAVCGTSATGKMGVVRPSSTYFDLSNNTLIIKSNKAIPSFSTSDAGKVLAISNDGKSLVWKTLS